jgi:hypothetical protein
LIFLKDLLAAAAAETGAEALDEAVAAAEAVAYRAQVLVAQHLREQHIGRHLEEASKIPTW